MLEEYMYKFIYVIFNIGKIKYIFRCVCMLYIDIICDIISEYIEIW